MSQKEKMGIVAVIALMCALTVVCVPVHAEEQKISPDNGGTHYSPRVSWNSVVWSDIDSNTGVYLYDLCTKSVEKISGPGAVDPDAPDVSGETVVWVDHRNSDPWASLYKYDNAAGTETRLEPQAGQDGWYYDQWNPAISGNTVVYMRPTTDADGGATGYVSTYDLGSGTFTQISPYWTYGGVTNEHPRIWGTKIVWSDQANSAGTYRIWLYDTGTREKTAISPADKEALNPDIDGNYVVWVEPADINDDMGDIVLYDIPAGTRTVIAEGYGRNPAVSGHRVVWEDDRNYQSTGTDVWRYDTVSRSTAQITTEEHNQKYPDVSNNYIVWQDDRNGAEIFLYDDKEVSTFGDMFQAPNAFTCASHHPLFNVKKWAIFTPQIIARPGSATPEETATVTPAAGNETIGTACSCTPVSGAVPLAVTCDSTGSQVSGGTAPAVVKWSFGDNIVQTGTKVTHTYTRAGTYTVTAVFKELTGKEESKTCASIPVSGSSQGTANTSSCVITARPYFTKTPVTWGDTITVKGSEDNCKAGLVFRLQKKPIPSGQDGPGGADIGSVPPSSSGYTFVFDSGAVQQQYGLTDGEYAVFIVNPLGGEYTKVAIEINAPVTITPTTPTHTPTTVGKKSSVVVTTTTTPPVPAANKAPVAVISALPSSGTAPLTVSFDASKSYDSDGTIAGYDWAFAKTALATGKTASYTFADAGTYTVTLAVTDDDGATGTATKTITVIEKVDLSHR